MTLQDQVHNGMLLLSRIPSYYSNALKTEFPLQTTQVTVRCPFHDDEHASLSINLDNGLWYCHGCGEKGNIFGFRMKLEGIDVAECVRRFANEFGLKIDQSVTSASEPKPRGKKIPVPSLEQIVQWREELHSLNVLEAKKFLNGKRGLIDDWLRYFGIGYDPGRRAIVIPLLDESGQKVIAAKFFWYNYSTGTKRIATAGKVELFGLNHFVTQYEKHNSVIICEGEIDSIIANQNGLLAVTGTGGAETWKIGWNDFFKGKNVVIAYDSDAAGRNGAQRVLHQLLGIAASVKVIDLFGERATEGMKDVSDFFLKDGKSPADLKKLIDDAPPISPDQYVMSPDLLSALTGESEEFLISPAQDFQNGVYYCSVKIGKEPYLLTSEGRCYSFDECEERGIEFTLKGTLDTFRFSRRGVREFLQRERQISPYTLFEDIKAYAQRHIVLTVPHAYDYVALWTIGTYVFRVFRYYPYLHLSGEKRSAKTLLLEILAPLAFNAEVTINSTEAVMFRDVHNNARTMLLDEIDLLRAKNAERYEAVMSVLKAGFAITGLVKRCGGANWDQIHSFCAYSPKAMAGIKELDDILADRSIRIRMLRKLKGEKVKRYIATREVLTWQQRTRDDLYIFALTYAHRVAELYEQYLERLEELAELEHLNDRQFDIWAPILVLAGIVDDARGDGTHAVTDAMLSFSKVKVTERAEDDLDENMTVRIVTTLTALVKQLPVREEGRNRCYNKGYVLNLFQTEGEFEKLETKPALTRLLKRVGVSVKNFSIEGKTQSLYVINLDVLQDYTERYVPNRAEL